MLKPELYATHEGAHLVLRLRDGIEHSRFPVADLDLAEQLAALESATAPAPAPASRWGLADLDAALARHRWARTSYWRLDDAGRTAARISTADT